ncbi:MAG: hypothetical protein IPM37_16460 [Hahellaceae bacterium]|nr:hypothetical protein [Hahellaceae bacterium]
MQGDVFVGQPLLQEGQSLQGIAQQGHVGLAQRQVVFLRINNPRLQRIQFSVIHVQNRGTHKRSFTVWRRAYRKWLKWQMIHWLKPAF